MWAGNLTIIGPFENTKSFLCVGDSKSGGMGDGYGPHLAKLTGMVELLPRAAHAGDTLSDRFMALDHDLAQLHGTPDYILIDIGTNDIPARDHFLYGPLSWEGPNWTRWQAAYMSYIGEWHQRYPTARIGIAKPYRFDTDHGRTFGPGWYVDMYKAINGITKVLSYTFPGVAEQDFLSVKGNSADGVHPTQQGYEVEALLWAEAISHA